MLLLDTQQPGSDKGQHDHPTTASLCTATALHCTLAFWGTIQCL